MPNLVNRLVLQELQQQIRAAEGLLVLSFGGLTVKQTEGLRNDLAKKGCELRMVRNSLARIVLAERGYEVDGKVLAGNTAIAFGSTEATIHAAKARPARDSLKAACPTRRLSRSASPTERRGGAIHIHPRNSRSHHIRPPPVPTAWPAAFPGAIVGHGQ